MRKLYFSWAFLAAMLGTTGARADIVKPYAVDFNTAVSTSSHDFKVGPGWGHLVDSYFDYDDYDTYYAEYSYTSTGGRDGSGAISVKSQKYIHNSYDTVYDLLVTPKLTGTASIYVKNRTSSSGDIKFFTVTYENGKYKKGDEITIEKPTLSSSDWTKVDIPEQENTYVGIWASNVIIDDFAADQADVELNKSLKITKSTFTGPQSGKVDCAENGKYTVSFTAIIQNTGDVTLTQGMENYSLSVINYKKADSALYTKPLVKTLEPGASDTVDVACEVAYTEFPSYTRFDVKENLTGTSAYGTWVTPVPFAPVLYLRDNDGRMDNGSKSYSWGMTNASAPKQFTLTNEGAAPLHVKSITVPDGFVTSIDKPFTLAAHQDTIFTVDMACTTAGSFSGTVTIQAEDVDDFTFQVSGTVLDPNKFFANFENGELPSGSYQEGDWSVAQRDYASAENVYLLSNGRQNGDNKFITPLLKVAEGEKMSVDVARTGYNTAGEGVYLNIYYSTDRKNWTLARKIEASELNDNRPVYSFWFSGLKTFEIDNIPAGNYYIGFGAGYTSIDNIYGFEPVAVAHDWVVNDLKVPAKATVNNEYTASATLKNINKTDETAGSYTATLYVDSQAVATAPAVDIPAGFGTTFHFAYTPHLPGVAKTYVEFKNTTDGYTVTSDTIDVTVEEEKASSSVTIGEKNDNRANVPVYWNYADSKAWTDNLYGPEMLKKFGLKAGSQITSIHYTGTPGGSKEFSDVTLTSYVGMVDSATFVAGQNFEELTKVDIYDHQPVNIVRGEEWPMDINLPEPIVWDGTSAIRVMNFIDGSGKYVNINFPTDGNYKTAYVFTRQIGQPTTYGNSLPVAEFGIKTEPVYFSGKVTCGETAIADADVTLTSGNVIYNGKTDTEGAYRIHVIQNDKKYALTVKADGYVTYTDSIEVGNGLEKDIALQEEVYSVSGKITYRNLALAGATISLTNSTDTLTATTNEEGSYRIESVKPHVKYALKAAADKFVTYEAADSIEIVADSTLADIVLVKAPVKVSGKVTYRGEALEGVAVNLTTAQDTLTATTDAKGEYSFDSVDADKNFALTATHKQFVTYAPADSVVFANDSILADIQLYRINVSVSGKVTWEGTAVAGAKVTLTRNDEATEATTDEDGHYDFADIVPDLSYAITVAADGFEPYSEADSIAVADTLKNKDIELTATPVALTVPETGRTTFSSERAIDFSKTQDIKAYVVTAVSGNHLTMKEVTTVPAHTGVYIEGAAGDYALAPVAKADDVEKNMLVATDADYTITDADQGKVWALTVKDGLAAFTSEVNTTIAKNQAYLQAESAEEVIYIYEVDGINALRMNSTDSLTPKYNLGGQKVPAGYQGVIILNGRKVVKK